MCHFVICLQPAWVLLLNLTLFPPAISSDVSSYHRDYHTCAYLCGTVPWHPKPLPFGSPWIASEAASLNLIIPLHPLIHCCPNSEAARSGLMLLLPLPMTAHILHVLSHRRTHGNPCHVWADGARSRRSSLLNQLSSPSFKFST